MRRDACKDLPPRISTDEIALAPWPSTARNFDVARPETIRLGRHRFGCLVGTLVLVVGGAWPTASNNTTTAPMIEGHHVSSCTSVSFRARGVIGPETPTRKNMAASAIGPPIGNGQWREGAEAPSVNGFSYRRF